MKKKRLMPMCLCLVLALGLAACDEIDDLLDSVVEDDETSETSPTEPGDTGDDTEPTDPEDPSESLPTYSIKITDPSEDISLEVGEDVTIGVSLVTTEDNTDYREVGTASEVTLSSSDPSVVSVEGLTITALSVGEAVITATWTEHNVTSEGVTITVTAPVVTPNPDVITYKVEITSPTSGSEIEINTETEVSVNLITITNGEEGEPVSATSSDVTIKESGSSILSITDLTITGLVEGEATIIATWNDHIEATDSITITIKNSNPGSGEGGEDVTTYGVSIASPTSATVLKVGDTLDVIASLITYTNGSETSTVAATYSDVTLTQNGSGSVTISNDSLTITGATAGDVTLTVTWTDHEGVTGGAASASVSFKVESVYTYKAVITAPTSGTEIEVGDTTDVSISLYTIIDGVEQTPTDATINDITFSQTGAGAVSFDGLTVKGVTAGEVTITATWAEQNVSDSVTITVTEPVVETITYKYVITIKNSLGQDMGTFPEGKSLYAAGSINSTYYDDDTGYWTYGEPYLLEANADYTAFTLTLDYVPELGREFKIYLHDNSATDTSDIWSYEVAYHEIVEYDVSLAEGQAEITYELEMWSYFSSWEKALAQEYPNDEEGSEQGGGSGDFVSYTTTVQIVNSNGTTFETAYGDYCVYVQSDFDNWGSDIEEGEDVSNGHKMTNNNDGTYSYTFTTLPDAGTYTFNVYPGDANGNSWKATAFTSYELTVTGSETGEYVAETKTSTSSYSDWNSIFATGADETFYIVFLDASGLDTWTSSMTINSGENCFNGNSYCSATQTKDGSSRIAWYSSAATLGSNATTWFNLTDGTNWMNTGDITIPDNSQGTPVYVAIGWFSGWTEGVSWSADQTGTGWQYMSTETTIEAFVQSLTSSN